MVIFHFTLRLIQTLIKMEENKTGTEIIKCEIKAIKKDLRQRSEREEEEEEEEEERLI